MNICGYEWKVIFSVSEYLQTELYVINLTMMSTFDRRILMEESTTLNHKHIGVILFISYSFAVLMFLNFIYRFGKLIVADGKEDVLIR